jgi:hypothetical protein
MLASMPTGASMAFRASESLTRNPSVARIVIAKRVPPFRGYPASSSSWLALATLYS